MFPVAQGWVSVAMQVKLETVELEFALSHMREERIPGALIIARWLPGVILAEFSETPYPAIRCEVRADLAHFVQSELFRCMTIYFGQWRKSAGANRHELEIPLTDRYILVCHTSINNLVAELAECAEYTPIAVFRDGHHLYSLLQVAMP